SRGGSITGSIQNQSPGKAESTSTARPLSAVNRAHKRKYVNIRRRRIAASIITLSTGAVDVAELKIICDVRGAPILQILRDISWFRLGVLGNAFPMRKAASMSRRRSVPEFTRCVTR